MPFRDYNHEIPTKNVGAWPCCETYIYNFNAFKIYALDVGLLGAMSQLDPRVLLEGSRLFEEFKGALTENFSAQMLQTHYQDNLYY